MKELTATEAEVRFGAVLDAVEAGEEVIVTRNGRRVARISPLPAPKLTREEAVRRLKTFAEGRTLGNIDWRDLRDEGRK
jgi:prevent-host-death family protein